jgi:hypothetical protein
LAAVIATYAGYDYLNAPFLTDRGQDKPLTPGQIQGLKDAGIDPEALKGETGTGKRDLHKDPQGNIIVKPKGGAGPGESTGYNIRNFPIR